MAYTTSWLTDSNAIRSIIVKITVKRSPSKNGSYDDTPLYLSSTPYSTGDNTVFLPIITGEISTNESLAADSSITLSYGNITLLNVNGDYDSYLDHTEYVWSNCDIEVYCIDPQWTFNTYNDLKAGSLAICTGVIEDISPGDRHTLILKLRDKIQRLNTSITEHKIGVTGVWYPSQPNSDSIRPLIFGEVHNVEPVLIDPSQLEYMVNDGRIQQITEIRDNGVPIYKYDDEGTAVTVDLSAGTFKLTSPAAGTITASIHGTKKQVDILGSTSSVVVTETYNNNLINILVLLVTQYGSDDKKLLHTDLDIDQLNEAQNSSNSNQYVGYIVKDKENLLSVCQEIARSCGGQIYFTRTGKLKFLQYGIPFSTNPAIEITERDMLFNTFAMTSKSTPAAAYKIGYAKNWTIQSGLTSAIPDEHKEIFATEWLSETVTDSTVASLYKLQTEPTQIDTMLIDKTQASNYGNRLLQFFKVPRSIFKFTGTARLFQLQLGQIVTLVYSRYGLSAGKTGQIVSLNPNWSKGRVEVEVLV